MPKPLAIIPSYMRQAIDLEVCVTAMRTLRETVGDSCDLMVVDDGSPAPDLVNGLGEQVEKYDGEYIAKALNEGFARTVNVGLRRALVEERDAVLINSDIEFGLTEDWLGLMQRQQRRDSKGLASVVGALLVYPNGLIQHGGIYFCSPADEPVLTVQDGYVPIADLDPGHGLVSYSRKENRIFRCATNTGRRTGYAFNRAMTPFDGELVVVEAGQHCARITPNHKLTVQWTEEALALHAVYLMRQGRRWRIGHTKMAHGGAVGARGWAFGPRLRLDQQRADSVWLLSLHGSKQEALERENLLAWKYRVPTLQFTTNGPGGLEQARLDYVWAQLDVESNARALLLKHGRDPELPLLVSRASDGRRRAPVGPSRRYEITAANLMDGYMTIPTDPGVGQKPEILPVRIERQRFVGDVFSLDVPPHEHYISGGVVVHNSMLTRDFGHRFNYGPANLPEAQVAAVCPVTGALQFIRYEALAEVGLYDESFRLGWEDVDFCVRIWLSGRECVYQPGIRALHHESFFRGQGRQNEKISRWTQESWLRFAAKYADTSFAEFVPNMLEV